MTKQNIYKAHKRNRDVLIKQGFTITNYAIFPNLILCAHHKDGRIVDIRI